MNKNNIIIKVPSVNLRISPYAFYKYANDFFNTANRRKKSTTFSPVLYYLYCHSIELSLKSLLLFLDKNKTIRDIKNNKNYGHNLESILRDTELKSGVALLNDKDKELIKKANYFYDKKGFEYYTSEMMASSLKGYKDLPDIIKLKNICNKLLKIVSNKIDK